MTPEMKVRKARGGVTATMLLIEQRHASCCGRRIEDLILDSIRRDGGQYVHLARLWDLSPSTLRRWIDVLGIGPEVANIRELNGLSTRGILPPDLLG